MAVLACKVRYSKEHVHLLYAASLVKGQITFGQVVYFFIKYEAKGLLTAVLFNEEKHKPREIELAGEELQKTIPEITHISRLEYRATEQETAKNVRKFRMKKGNPNNVSRLNIKEDIHAGMRRVSIG